MKIKRKQLLNDLQDFASRGDGVIIGSPGVGKTYVLKELRQRLKANEVPHLLLRIDQLGDGTAETLQQELSYKGDLIEKLKSIPVSGKNAILLFDAFDAARDEQTRKRFLNLIGRAIRELVKWNVVVTVRTYDAKKSQELLDLFGSPGDTEYQSENILCRHFTIPIFNPDEILQALNQIGCPQSVYNDGSQDFKNILANPFNLWLLEKILKTSPDLPDFSQVRSEVQLLGFFWERRIEARSNGDTRRFVLEGIAKRMVEKRLLVIKQYKVYEELNLDVPVRQAAWNDLLSDEILTKISSTGGQIAFSHNILFDYAISVLLIEDDPKELETFVEKDPSRPLFLRPSLTYFFTRLWYYDSKSFWRTFWHIFPNDQSVHLRLVARLIPTSAIASEAREINQFEPLLEKLRSGEDIANEAIIRLLQALRTLQIERDVLWSEFFDRVSEYLHANFAWDLATLTTDILERSTDAKVKSACGRVGRRLLKWVWHQRETDENDWYNRFGGRWAVPLVAETYDTNVKESRALLEKVLQLTKEENFPISFLSWLTEHVNSIWTHDPEFVVSIYHTVFAYYELSRVKTNVGDSSVMPMTSTRRQDYSMCQYRLIRHFPNFLQAKPLEATRAAIQSLNFFILREHVVGYLKRDVTLEDLVEMFNFRGKNAYFLEDGSYIWAAQNSSDKPIKMVDALFEYIGELAMSEDPRLDLLLDVFCDEVLVAFFWKRLLKAASQFPAVFAQPLFELCVAEPIHKYSETFYELCLFLAAAAAEFTPDQLRQIEERILAYPIETTDEEHRKLFERERNRLLAQIPVDLLSTDEARRIREEMERENDIPENQPLVSFSTSTEPVTKEKWLQRQGVDTTDPENQELQHFSAPLNKFSSDWMNGVPTMEASKLVLPQLEKAFTAIKNNTEADKEVMNSLWHELTACMAILGRVANKLKNSEFSFCREVLLEAAKHEEPKLNSQYDDHFNSPGYSPCARHEAARGLLRFAFYQPDAEILDAIEILAGDLVPSVRMVTAMELFLVYVKAPERFWHIMDNRAIHEPNRIVQKYLYRTLTRVVTREDENEDRTTHVMAKLLEHTPPPTEGLEPSDPFINLLVGLTIVRRNAWASKTIEDTFFKDPVRFANPLSHLVSQIMDNYVIPKNLETPDRYEVVEQGALWVSRTIIVAANALKKLSLKFKGPVIDEEVKGKLQNTYGVIDAVVTRLYFTVAYDRSQGEKSEHKIPYELRCRFYNKVKPLMAQVIDFAQEEEYGIMFAPTAHYFMQLLTSFLSCNPKEVLHLAAKVVQSSERFNYTFDSIAIRDIVEFVEIILADHRDEVQDGEALEDLLNLLDMFAKTGWSDALKLVWRLDEVFR